MSAHSHRPVDPRASFILRWSALSGVFIALLTLILSPLVRDGLQDGGTALLRAAAISALLVGPFLVALVALHWRSKTVARTTWLLCGLVALGVGAMLAASGVGFFLAAAGIGLIAAWWLALPEKP
ncbi:MAG: hypothetical protein M3Z20_05405 [Chloroflexota bacterium]|nr:hypothetical protein [Chloroflexota bacterium]